MSDAPDVIRVRHELKRRTLTVARVERLAPKMLRVVLRGEELQGFTSLGFDDHVKLLFSAADGSTEMRDFTPRRFDAGTGELWIDFFVHETGPASTWAAQAAPGQSLLVGGPKGSSVISPEGIDSHVLIGDECALPAIARRLEELPQGARALVFAETDGGPEWPNSAGLTLSGPSATDVVWIARIGEAGAPGAAVIEKLRDSRLPAGRTFFWVATESQAARAIRRYLSEERGIEKRWIKAAGYWQRGAAGAHDKLEAE